MVSLSSWDSIFIIDMARVNLSLAANSSGLITSFDFSGGGGSLSTPYRCTGQFGAWALDQGSAGDLLRLKLLITSGSISSDTNSVDLSGMTAIMEISLTFLPDAINPSVANLVFSFQKASQVGQPPQQDVVTPVMLMGATDRLNQLGVAGQNDLLNGMANLLCSQASALNYIFAQLNLVAPASHFWLTPKHFAYQYYSIGSPTKGFLAILSVITDRLVEGLNREVDAALFPDSSSDMSFAFAGDLFLEHLLLPALPAAFGSQARISNFSFDANNHRIVCAGAFNLDSVKSGAITYDPRVIALTVQAISEGISLAVSGDCDMKADINMTYSVSSNPSLHFHPGSQSLSFTPDPNPVSQHDVDIPWWWWLGGTIIREVVDLVTSIIANDLVSNLSSHLSRNIAGQIQPCIVWTDISAMHVNNISLDGGFVMRGTAS